MITTTTAADKEAKPKKKYASEQAYRMTQQRSTFAISKDLFPGLAAAVAASGAGSVSDLLRCIASLPEDAGTALQPLVQRASIVYHPKPRKRYAKAEINEIAATLKDAGLSPEQIAQLREQAEALRLQNQKELYQS